MRSTAKLILHVGLVALPVRLYLLASENTVKLVTLAPSGLKAKHRTVDPATCAFVPPEDIVKAVELGPSSHARVSASELAELARREGHDGTVTLNCAAPRASLALTSVRRALRVLPEKGAERRLDTFYRAMRETGLALVGSLTTTRTVRPVVLLAGESDELLLAELYRTDEMRHFSASEGERSSRPEIDLTVKLLESLEVPSIAHSTASVEDTLARAILALARERAGAPLALLEELKASVPKKRVEKRIAAKKRARAKPRAKRPSHAG